jgi:hypothetical protein
MEGFTSLTETIPVLAGHAAAMFVGMVLVGLGQRVKQPVE